MDLPALLAREGLETGDVDALVKWARQRSAALIARIEPGSPLAEALGAGFEKVRDSNGAPVPNPRAPSRGAPRSVGRAVSRPYLGAAVEAALSGKQADLDLALETAAAEAEANARAEAPTPTQEPEPEAALELDLEMPADPPAETAAPEPTPEPEEVTPDENDPYIGGFNRFAFSVRRRAAEAAAQQAREEESRRQQNLSRGFERHSEDQSRPKTGWDHAPIFLPEPPGFEADARARARRANMNDGDGEASGLLVLGIPDEEGGDIPVRRAHPPNADIADADPSSSFTAELSLLDETSGPHAAADAPAEPPRPAPRTVAPELSLQIVIEDDGPVSPQPLLDDDDAAFLERPPSSPQPHDDDTSFTAASTPQPAASTNPQLLDDDDAPFLARAPSGPQPAASTNPQLLDDDDAPFIARAPSGPQPVAHAASHSPLDDDDDAPFVADPPRAASGPQAVAHAPSGPQGSGPTARAPSGPQSARTGPPPPPPPRSSSAPSPSAKRTPPPPPRGPNKTTVATVVPQPIKPIKPVKPAKGSKPPSKKKVVELSQPVARPVSAPLAMAAPRPAAPSERSGHRPIPADDEVLSRTPAVPDYLRDDDE